MRLFFPRRTSVPRLERIAKARRRSRFGVREREEGVLRQKPGKRREDAIPSRPVPSRPSGSFQHGGGVVLPEAAVDQSSLLFPRPRVRGALGIQSVFLQPTWVGPVAAVPPVAHPALHPSQCDQAGAERVLKGRNLCLNHIRQCTAKKLKRSPRWLPVAPRCKAQRVGGSLHPPTHPPRGCLPIPGLPLGGVRRLTRSGVSGAAPGGPPDGPVRATVHAWTPNPTATLPPPGRRGRRARSSGEVHRLGLGGRARPAPRLCLWAAGPLLRSGCLPLGDW